MASSQLVKKVLCAAARFKRGFAASGEIHKNPRHVRGFLYKPTASAPIRAHADAGILDRKRGFDRRLFEKRSFSTASEEAEMASSEAGLLFFTPSGARIWGRR